MDYNHPYCEVSIDGYTIAEVYNDNEYGNKVILYESNKCDIELGDFTAVLDFCSYYIKKSIPKNYLVRYIEIMHNKKQFIFSLYNSAISASLLYIASLNECLMVDENTLFDDFIDMEYLFKNFISLLDSGHLENVPIEVIHELVHEIEIADLPLTKQQRAILERHASPSPPPNFSP
ncbi:hypothetical protein [Saliniramus fredricksonii]|nr:hypothetical protein [Saliniramus fredricksonii]